MDDQELYTPEDYTGSSTFVHLHNHTIYSTLDGVSLPQQYADECSRRGYPAMSATEHGHMGSVPDMYAAFKKVGVKFIAACFLPGQPVLMENGVSTIDVITPGDMVITGENRPRRALNVQSRDYDGEVIRIKAWGVEEIVATPEHPFLVREVTRSEGKRGCWTESITLGMRKASELSREKYHRTYTTKRSKDRTNKRRYRFYLCVPRLRVIDEDGYQAIDTKKHVRSLQNVPPVLLVDDELLWIMGLWLAEGTARYGELSFWLGADEYHFYERIADYFADFGINTSFRYRKDRRALNVTVYSVCFADLFPALFGHGFAGKRIPWDMMNLMNASQTKCLLNGLFDGDAKIGPEQSYLKLNNRSLVWQARLLLSRLGQYSAITPMLCNNSENLSYIVRRRESGHFYYDYDDQYIYLPVAGVEREKYAGKVYNMEVEEDNTYNVGVAVHNCEIYFNDYEPERQQLGPGLRKLRVDDPERYLQLARNRHLTVLAKNEVGYTNLIKLTTQAYRTGFYYRPRIWYDKLLEFKEGLIILSGCLNGPVCHELRRTTPDGEPRPRLHSPDKRGAIDWIKRFRRDFGDDYGIELQMPGIPGDELVFRQLVTVADHLKIPIVLANDCWNPDVLVQTCSGSKEIRNIRPGDLVWTHRGRLREVMTVGKRRVCDGEKLYGFLGSSAIQCTANHKLLCKIDDRVGFVPIENIPPDAYINVARVTLSSDGLTLIKASDYVSDPRARIDDGLFKPRGGKTLNPIVDEIVLSDEFLWALGLYVADGSTDAYRLSFGHHTKEMAYAERLKKFFDSHGFNTNIKAVTGTENGIVTRVCSSGFAYLFGALCGTNRYSKKLPPFWTQLSVRQLVVLLRGYFDGDGSVGSRSFFTTSIQLMTDLMHAFAAVGVGVTPRLRPAKDMVISHTKKRGKIRTRCSEGYYGNISKIGLNALGYRVDFDQAKSRPRWYLDDDGIWIKNPFVQINSSLGEVWCIQVDEDNSFLMGVTSSNCHYLERRDFQLQKVMMAIDQGLPVNSPDLFHVNSDEQYMKTRAELWARFKNYGYSKGFDDAVFERACDNTLMVAERCQPLKIDASPKIPSFQDADKELARLIARRLHALGLTKIDKRYLIDGKEVTYKDQARVELERIIEKGYSSYFLITHDLINYGLERGWPFSPRGSAGGSLVNYLLGISPINPLPWGLSFDRFLSPSRGGFMQSLDMPQPISRIAAGATSTDPVGDGDGDKEVKWNANQIVPVRK